LNVFDGHLEFLASSRLLIPIHSKWLRMLSDLDVLKTRS
jgi:hypothetical protein